ncbi:type II CAAX endopeptidase family protein [Halodesulfurarchaeum sp. HSR-GB]|uniref:CPBP family intramembrane glutamic endopeptidase n=1 Tax=Halodesulfurarchaeum sp. HSR-GB TaxID=3074077 RepID=UPI002865442D|nr:type II CAAX endopeptidase family protein [Halodesulfurarchaeum sp. HSR-GB]MDR5656812.1 type II CAAX endopeptidase family protein [Halodesulfurarchaeum sp. HSR-GB]
MSDTDPWRPVAPRGSHQGYALLGAIAAGIGGILLAFGLSAVLGLAIGGFFRDLSLLVMVGLLFLTSALGLVGGGVLYLRYRGLSPRAYVPADVPGLRDLLYAGGGYVAAMGLVFAAGVALTVGGVQPETTNQAAELGIENPELLLWLVPLSLFVIAPSEEFLFRGVVQGRLREAFSAQLAIPLTAALFALVHYFSLTGGSGARFIAIAILFLPSLVFGVAYERTENLVVPILIHGVYNSTLVLLLYVSISVMGDVPAAI